MILKRIWLKDFRSYSNFKIDNFSSNVTLVTGENGKGKTNLIEAIYYISNLNSFRFSSRESLIKNGSKVSFIRAEITNGERELLIESEISLLGRDKTLINKQKIIRNKEIRNYFKTIVFSNSDIEIVKNGPSYRRNFLDDLMIDLYPKMIPVKLELEKILKHRSKLLKTISYKSGKEELDTLDIWNQKLSEVGEFIVKTRKEVLTILQPELEKSFYQLSFNEKKLQIEYISSWEGRLIDALQKTQKEDLLKGLTSVGPHRDDLSIKINNLFSRDQVSQGQQRIIAISLKLASHKVIKKQLSLSPLLLLDDVFSELDEIRSKKLLENLPSSQTIITAAQIPSNIFSEVPIINLNIIGN